MKCSTISFAFLPLVSLCYGAPGSAHLAARQIEGTIRFLGAGPNPPEYDLNVPCDGSTFFTNNALSVSQILSDVPPECACTFFGIDGSVTSTLGVDDVDVGPPQTQVSGTCSPETPARKPRQVVVIEAVATFSGAGPNPPTYSETFPADGIAQPITDPLSVSHITLSSGVTCTFFGADGSETEVSSGETMDVGPPQPQVSGVCERED